MKKIIFAILAVSLVVVACRKKVIREVETADTIGVLHCMNGIQDGDEVGVDCGGADCADCNQTVLPCTIDSNEIYYQESVVSTTDGFINQTYSVSGNGAYTFRAYTADGDSINLKFAGQPDVGQVYTGTAYSTSIANNEVYVEYFQPFPLADYIGGGSIYVNNANGQYTISCCDYSFHEWGLPTPSLTQFFSITF